MYPEGNIMEAGGQAVNPSIPSIPSMHTSSENHRGVKTLGCAPGQFQQVSDPTLLPFREKIKG